MNRAYVDANVILRLITGDPPDLADRAERLFEKAHRGEIELVVEALVAAEVVWVLSSFYGYSSAEVAPVVSSLLVSNGVVGEEKTELLQALALYEKKNVDFVDAFLAVKMCGEQVEQVYSFDKHFDRLESVTRIEPD